MTISDRMAKAYLEAVVFTEWGDTDQPPSDMEFSPLAKAQAYIECRNLLWANEDILNAGNCESAGRDLWFNRNGHGTGFWDSNLHIYDGAANNDILDRCARSMGSRDVYLGDDGMLYFS